MIDIDPSDIVTVRHTAEGRFVIFTSSDILPHWKQRFWGVVLDTGGDGHGALVRYGPAGAPAGWSVRQLIQVVQARMAAEEARAPVSGARAVMDALASATAFRPSGDPNSARASAPAGGDPPMVAFDQGDLASPYEWTVARCGDLDLPLCPDSESREEGITPEQLLIVIEQMLIEWAKLSPHRLPIREARLAAKAALAAEVKRVAITRGTADPAGPSV